MRIIVDAFGGDNALVVIRYRDDKRIESIWRHRMRATGRFEMDFDVGTAVLTAKLSQILAVVCALTQTPFSLDTISG